MTQLLKAIDKAYEDSDSELAVDLEQILSDRIKIIHEQFDKAKLTPSEFVHLLQHEAEKEI